MKMLLILMPLIMITSNAQAADRYSKLKKVQTDEAQITIITKDDAVQAANYVTGNEIEDFIAFQLKDKNSSISKAKAAIIEQNCSEVGTEEDSEGNIDSCGSFEMSTAVQVGFSRSGWQDTEARYVVFFGFRSWGTGMELEMSKAVAITEYVSATSTDEGEFSGTLFKNYSVTAVKNVSY